MTGIKATREGLVGRDTSCGWKINNSVSFVALPSEAAKFQRVVVSYPNSGKYTTAIVLDTGPWNTDDDEYVFGGARPQAESGVDKSGRKTNGAGIDLGEKVRKDLDIPDNEDNAIVDWWFVPVTLDQVQGKSIT
jgi:hypothetical protein